MRRSIRSHRSCSSLSTSLLVALRAAGALYAVRRGRKSATIGGKCRLPQDREVDDDRMAPPSAAGLRGSYAIAISRGARPNLLARRTRYRCCPCAAQRSRRCVSGPIGRRASASMAASAVLHRASARLRRIERQGYMRRILLAVAAALEIGGARVAVVGAAEPIPREVAAVAAGAPIGALILRPAEGAVIRRIVQQGVIVARALLAGVAQRLIAFGPFFDVSGPEISQGHERGLSWEAVSGCRSAVSAEGTWLASGSRDHSDDPLTPIANFPDAVPQTKLTMAMTINTGMAIIASTSSASSSEKPNTNQRLPRRLRTGSRWYFSSSAMLRMFALKPASNRSPSSGIAPITASTTTLPVMRMRTLRGAPSARASLMM